MNGVRKWLESLGFHEYVEAFEHNAIEFDVLPELTDGDLKELGVSALGHRKRLLREISALASPDVEDSLPASQPGRRRIVMARWRAKATRSFEAWT